MTSNRAMNSKKKARNDQKLLELKQKQLNWLNEMKETRSVSRGQPEIAAALEKPTSIATENWYGLNSKLKKLDITDCPICEKPMLSPHLAIPCGHSFCQACLTSKLPKCGVCFNPVQGNVPNLALQQVLDSRRIAESTVDFDQDPSHVAKQFSCLTLDTEINYRALKADANYSKRN